MGDWGAPRSGVKNSEWGACCRELCVAAETGTSRKRRAAGNEEGLDPSARTGIAARVAAQSRWSRHFGLQGVAFVAPMTPLRAGTSIANGGEESACRACFPGF
jgi:hypothetical protein